MCGRSSQQATQGVRGALACIPGTQLVVLILIVTACFCVFIPWLPHSWKPIVTMNPSCRSWCQMGDSGAVAGRTHPWLSVYPSHGSLSQVGDPLGLGHALCAPALSRLQPAYLGYEASRLSCHRTSFQEHKLWGLCSACASWAQQVLLQLPMHDDCSFLL